MPLPEQNQQRERRRAPSRSIEYMSTPTSRIAMPARMFRRLLALCDLTAVAAAWAMVLLGLRMGEPGVHGTVASTTWLVVAVAVTAVVLAREQVYLSRVLAIRAVEVQRVGRSCLIAAALLVVVDRMVGAPLGPVLVSLGSLSSYGLLLVARGAMQAWLHEHGQQRTAGRCLLVVGDRLVASRTLEVLHDRPELGYAVVGYVAARRAEDDLGVPWLGTPDDLALLTRLTGVGGVVIAGAPVPDAVTAGMSDLRMLDVHVHVAFDDGAREPDIRILPLVQRGTAPTGRPALSAWQQAAKRGFDVLAGGMLAVAAAPVLAIAAVTLKLAIGGPVFVRDVRVGPSGERLLVTRLRTSGLPENGVGQWIARTCRRLSIDELPQLLSVLRGSMSLVGPRPARPDRLDRHVGGPAGVHAGLIGLRHVEARDYPEHVRHRRLDHFYAENWSLSLDVSILAASATHVLWRTSHDGVGTDEHAIV